MQILPDRGKGGHCQVRLADRLTTVKSGEIGKGLLAKMLRDMNVPKDEF